jgi:hypothetical protein
MRRCTTATRTSGAVSFEISTTLGHSPETDGHSSPHLQRPRSPPSPQLKRIDDRRASSASTLAQAIPTRTEQSGGRERACRQCTTSTSHLRLPLGEARIHRPRLSTSRIFPLFAFTTVASPTTPPPIHQPDERPPRLDRRVASRIPARTPPSRTHPTRRSSSSPLAPTTTLSTRVACPSRLRPSLFPGRGPRRGCLAEEGQGRAATRSERCRPRRYIRRRGRIEPC